MEHYSCANSCSNYIGSSFVLHRRKKVIQIWNDVEFSNLVELIELQNRQFFYHLLTLMTS